MSHAVVLRVAIALSLLLGAAGLLFAWTVRRGEPDPTVEARVGRREPAEAAELFRSRCAACHDAEDLRAVLEAGEDGARAVLETLDFLETHGGSSAEEDRAILLYLSERR